MEKVIKTNYKVAVLANQLEKRIKNDIVDLYQSSSYRVFQEKHHDGTRRVYVTASDDIITGNALQHILNIAVPVKNEYRIPSVCISLTTIERDGKTRPVVCVQISKTKVY